MSAVVGSVGVGLLLLAFALQRIGRIEERWYAGVNAVGAAAAAAASLMIGFIPFVVLELIWCLVALASLVWGSGGAVADRGTRESRQSVGS